MNKLKKLWRKLRYNQELIKSEKEEELSPLERMAEEMSAISSAPRVFTRNERHKSFHSKHHPDSKRFVAKYNEESNEKEEGAKLVEFRYVFLEEYLELLQANPIVHKVSLLFDDRPNEASIRVEYVDNIFDINAELLDNAREELSLVTSALRVNKCERLEITYIQREVIT
jgi:hypothetical protein